MTVPLGGGRGTGEPVTPEGVRAGGAGGTMGGRGGHPGLTTGRTEKGSVVVRCPKFLEKVLS